MVLYISVVGDQINLLINVPYNQGLRLSYPISL